MPAQATSNLLLHPGCVVTEDDGALLVTRGAARLRIEALMQATLAPAVYWPDMGIEESTTRIEFHWPQAKPQPEPQVQIEPVEAFYVDDLSAFLKQLKKP